MFFILSKLRLHFLFSFNSFFRLYFSVFLSLFVIIVIIYMRKWLSLTIPPVPTAPSFALPIFSTAIKAPTAQLQSYANEISVSTKNTHTHKHSHKCGVNTKIVFFFVCKQFERVWSYTMQDKCTNAHALYLFT